MSGNVKCFGENLPVPAGLVEHVYKVTVLKYVLYLAGREQIFYILSNPGWNSAPFPKTFPYFYRVSCGLFFFEKQMKFITVEPGMFMGIPVFRDPPPHLILDNEHSQLFQLFSQIFNVETYQTVIQIDVCLVVEYV